MTDVTRVAQKVDVGGRGTTFSQQKIAVEALRPLCATFWYHYSTTPPKSGPRGQRELRCFCPEGESAYCPRLLPNGSCMRCLMLFL
jgi:hypothetical protein